MVEKREAGYYVHGSRVPLDNLVYLWREGASNEYIQESYPTLEPDQVKGALQFYFANRFEVDSWIEDCERQESALLARMRTDPQYLRRVERLRGELELKP